MHLRATLLDRIDRASPRVVRIVAGPGWGKSTFVRALTARASSAAVVEAAEAVDRKEFERLVLDALAAVHGPLEAGSLREAWAAPGTPDVVVLEDLHALDAASIDVVRILLRAMPPGRSLIMTSRAPLPFELSRYFAPHETCSLTAADLALTEDERRTAIDDGGRLDPRTLERAVALSRGWPICTYLFGRFAREGRLTELLDRLEDRAFDDLYAYVEAEILADLEPEELDLLLLCACGPVIGDDDVRGVLGAGALARLGALVAREGYVVAEDGSYRAPILGASVARTRPAALAAMRSRCAEARDARGDHCAAAAMWLANGDPARAAASLERVGPPLPGVTPPQAYLRILLRMPLDALLHTRHAFVALLGSPRTAASPLPLERRAREICEHLRGTDERPFRNSALLALAVLSLFASQLRRADDLLAALDDETRGEPLAPERAALFAATRAAVWSLRGRTADASALWASLPLEDAHGRTVFEMQRFLLIVGIGLSAGDDARLAPEVERQMALARRSGDPLWIADARITQAWYSRRFDDEVGTAETLLRAIETEELTGAHPADYEHIMHPVELPLESRSILSNVMLCDMAFEQRDPVTARRMLESAIGGLDRVGRRHFQIAARLMLAAVPGASRARLLEEARFIAAEVQEPRTLASVEAIAAGRYAEAASFPFVVRRLHQARFDIPAESSLQIEVLRARVVRSGATVALRAREFEIVAALALARAPLSRFALAARLWGEDEAEDAAPALRTALHRLRKALGDPDAVLYEHGAYRLGPLVTVDVHDIEASLAALQRLRAHTSRERDRLREIGLALTLAPPDLYQEWDWMRPHLAHLLELRHRAAMLLGEAALAEGSPQEAVTIADAVLRVEPLDEPVVELAIRALLADGRRPDAVRRARRYADELARDLGGEPSSPLLRDLAGEPEVRTGTGRGR